VTEQQGYTEKGSHINFIMSDDKVEFEANPKAIKKTGISVSSELLKHAIIVDGK
jgi:hypothetical protein